MPESAELEVTITKVSLTALIFPIIFDEFFLHCLVKMEVELADAINLKVSPAHKIL